MLSPQRALSRLYQIQKLVPPSSRMLSSVANRNEEVLFDACGNTRIITLNRPKALNALNANMVEKIIPYMKRWTREEQVAAIIIKGAGEKAFCAGGDIKAVTEEGKKDPNSLKATNFFRREYVLNHLIGTCPIPYVAMIDGICMGGGVGLSVHAPFRVASSTTTFAMPETAIGLFPDVGGSYFLSRLPGAEGLYLSLTGHRLKGEDVFRAGIATHYVTHEGGLYSSLMKELISLSNPTRDTISELLDSYHKRSVSTTSLSYSEHKDKIDYLFSLPTLEEIFTGLEREGSEWSQKTLKTLKKMSPVSMKITMEQLRRGKDLSLGECLQMELRMGRTIMQNHDFYEGVRAVLIDKDNTPNWRPSSIELVTDDMVQSYFRPMPNGAELEFE